MKKIITMMLIASMLSAPVAAGTHTFKDGPLKGKSFKTDNWPQHRCDTFVSVTRAQNRKVVNHCIGKMPKSLYVEKYNKFLVDYAKANDDRVKRIKRLGAMALLHPDIKWRSEKKHKTVNELKIAMATLGSLLGFILGVAGGMGGIISAAVIIG